MAELNADGSLRTLFVYGTKPNVPDYMIHDTDDLGTFDTYQIISDHLGSVRLVVKVSDGTVVQRIDYDNEANCPRGKRPRGQPNSTRTAGVDEESPKDCLASRSMYEFGIVTNTTSSDLQPFGFAGGIWDSETGLVRFGARDSEAMPTSTQEDTLGECSLEMASPSS